MSAIDTTHPFEYPPLLHGDSIRILHLFPGEEVDPLVGSLEVISLGDDTSTTFEAISYVWGSYTRDQVIHIHGKRLDITANLSVALRQCRLHDRVRTLWADSICINQVNLEEKSHQVSLMSRVYSVSQCTVICFGNDCEGHRFARDAASLVSKINEMMKQVFQGPNFSWEPGSFPYPSQDGPLLRIEQYEQLDKMLDHTWFTRGWVVQEAALGREALILWADVSIPFIEFLGACEWIYRCRLRLDNVRYWGLSMVYHLLYVYRRPQEYRTFYDFADDVGTCDILEVLDGARILCVSEARDRIYACCALPFYSDPMPAPKPDYLQPIQQIYREFAIDYFRATSSLEFLSYAYHDRDPFEDPQYSSWAPRWDIRRSLTEYCYRPDTNPPRPWLDGKTLTIEKGSDEGTVTLRTRGIVLDKSIAASAPVNSSITVEDIKALWENMLPILSDALCPSPHDRLHDCLAFLHALTVGKYFASTPEEKEVDLIWSFAQHLLNAGKDLSESATQHTASRETQYSHKFYDVLISGSSDSRRVIRLAGGVYGSAQLISRAGDVCALILGASTPLILREVPGKTPTCYRVVGPVRVQSRHLNSTGLPYDLTEIMDVFDDFETLSIAKGWKDRGLFEEDILLE